MGRAIYLDSKFDRKWCRYLWNHHLDVLKKKQRTIVSFESYQVCHKTGLVIGTVLSV